MTPVGSKEVEVAGRMDELLRSDGFELFSEGRSANVYYHVQDQLRVCVRRVESLHDPIEGQVFRLVLGAEDELVEVGRAQNSKGLQLVIGEARGL